MRILSLHIDGYGSVRDLTLENLPPGLVVFVGDNEAGKTTCLSFVRDILFGFRDGRSAENNYLPSDGGRYGGRITLATDRMGEVVIERRPGKRGGAVSVQFSDGRKGGEEALPLILGATTRELFKNVYAFTLSELQTIETLKSESVKGVLYGAALGASTLNLPTALASIDAKMGELFKPAGRKTLINLKLADLEEKRKALRDARNSIDEYDHASVRLVEVEQRLEVLRVKLAAERQEWEKTTTFIRLWDDWLTLADLVRAFEGLTEHVDAFPEAGIGRLDRLREKIEEADRLQRDLRAECDIDRKQAASLLVNDLILAQSGMIRELLSKREIYLNDCSNLIARTQSIEAAGTEIRRILGDLGSAWTEERALSVDRSLFTREAIIRHQKELEECATEARNRANLTESKKAELEVAIKDEEQARKLLAEYGEITVDADDATVRSLQGGRDRFAALIRELPQTMQQIEEGRKRVNQAIAEISPEWDESDVEHFDCSIAARQWVQAIEDRTTRFKGQIARTVEESERIRNALDAEEQQLKDAVGRLDHLGAQPTESKAAIDERKTSLRTLRLTLIEKEKLEGQVIFEESRLLEAGRRRDEYADQATVLSPPNLRPLSLVLAAAAGLMFVLLLSSLPKEIPIVAGAMLLLMSIALFWLDRSFREKLLNRRVERDTKRRNSETEKSGIEANLSAIRATLRTVNGKAEEIAGALFLKDGLSLEKIDLAESETEREAARITEWETTEGQCEQVRLRTAALRKDLATLEVKGVGMWAELETAQKEWADYLKKRKLPIDLAPRAGNLVFLKIEHIRAEIDRLRDLQGRASAMEETRNSYCALVRAVAALAVSAESDDLTLLSAIDGFLDEMREMEMFQKRREAAVDTLRERSERRKKIAEELRAVADALVNARKAEAEKAECWRDWLGGHGLSSDISPIIALEAFGKISDCVAKIGEKERLEKEVARLQSSTTEYIGSGRSLFIALGEPVPSDDTLPAAIDRATEELEAAKTNKTVREGLWKKIDALSIKIEEQERALVQYRNELKDLLAAACVDTEDEFRRKARLFEERQQLIVGIERTESNLKKASGEEDLARLKKELGDLSLERLKAAKAEHQEAVQDLERERDALRQQRADLNSMISRLASADDVARLRADEESITAEIRTLAKEWGRFAMAKALLAEARRRYEQEQQPKVINDAGRYFREMTGGKYEKVIAPLGEETFEVKTNKGEMKGYGILSRGTLEQLYLAIRFAYITNYSAHGESLPVIMDDVLVNFDPKRTEHAIQAILTLAENHQVLYFTCHPETVEHCRNCRVDTPVFRLSPA